MRWAFPFEPSQQSEIAQAKKDDDVEFVSEAVEVIDVADDSDSDVVAYPETPVKREVATPVPCRSHSR